MNLILASQAVKYLKATSYNLNLINYILHLTNYKLKPKSRYRKQWRRQEEKKSRLHRPSDRDTPFGEMVQRWHPSVSLHDRTVYRGAQQISIQTTLPFPGAKERATMVQKPPSQSQAPEAGDELFSFGWRHSYHQFHLFRRSNETRNELLIQFENLQKPEQKLLQIIFNSNYMRSTNKESFLFIYSWTRNRRIWTFWEGICQKFIHSHLIVNEEKKDFHKNNLNQVTLLIWYNMHLRV